VTPPTPAVVPPPAPGVPIGDRPRPLGCVGWPGCAAVVEALGCALPRPAAGAAPRWPPLPGAAAGAPCPAGRTAKSSLVIGA
jgi:hypothetical protein